ncbi:MAG TPA: M20/M25/M40 family metallo-hydrolase [Gemmatimonadaceae bacterium]|nr:M20/M25/M40 family metallo-hydrolase [Gemmatimonadaceae bacterium]
MRAPLGRLIGGRVLAHRVMQARSTTAIVVRLALLATPLLTAALHAQRPPAQRPVAGADVRAAVRKHRESHEAEIAREFADLLAIPNVASDSVNIRRNAAAVIELLRRRGVTARTLEGDAGPPAVYGELRTPGATRTIVFYAHYDGQPVVPSQWTGAPFEPVLRDGSLAAGAKTIPLPAAGQRMSGESRIYARSASDDKGAIIAMLGALDGMRSANIAPSVNLKFFFEGEEEAGSTHLRRLLEKHADVLRADAWVFCDGPVHQSGRQQVVFGARGVMGLELTTYGPARALHSGHYGNWAPNPAALMANLIASMRDDDGRILIAGFMDDVRPITAAERTALGSVPPIDTTLRKALAMGATEAQNAPLAERIMLPALNVRGIRVGGVRELAANAIPTEADASIDFRLVPNQKPERVRELVEAHLRSRGYYLVHDTPDSATRMAHPKIVRVEWDGGYAATKASMDIPFSRALLAAASSGAATPPIAMPMLGGSLPTSTFEQVLAVPLVVLPIANYDNNQHAANENLRLQNLWDGMEMFAAVMARIGHEWRESAVP